MGYHRDLHVRTHSCPTRRSSDLVDRVLVQRVALGRRLGGFGLGGQVLHLRRLAFAVPGDAVRKIVHHVQARDVLLVEVVDRVRILLAEDRHQHRSEEHTSELQSLMRISYAVFCLKKKTTKQQLKQATDTKLQLQSSSTTNLIDKVT